jgi:hypothetical protein
LMGCPSPMTVRALPAGQPSAEWLRCGGGLTAACEPPVPEQFSERLPEQMMSSRLPELCFEHYPRRAPLHPWLIDLLPE